MVSLPLLESELGEGLSRVEADFVLKEMVLFVALAKLGEALEWVAVVTEAVDAVLLGDADCVE